MEISGMASKEKNSEGFRNETRRISHRKKLDNMLTMPSEAHEIGRVCTGLTRRKDKKLEIGHAKPSMAIEPWVFCGWLDET
jgi:hypothetical protein